MRQPLCAALFLLICAAELHAKPETVYSDPVSGAVNMLVFKGGEHAGIRSFAAANPSAAAQVLVGTLREQLGCRDSEFRSVGEGRDELGMSHVTISIERSGIPLLNTTLGVHFTQGGDVKSISGPVDCIRGDGGLVNLSKEDATESAIKVWSQSKLLLPGRSEATLFYFNRLAGPSSQASADSILVWRVRLSANDAAWDYLINAADGTVEMATTRERRAGVRYVSDCSSSDYGDMYCLYDKTNGYGSYVFGRSEGQPARGPNPTYSFYGSYDVDNAYNLLAYANNFYLNYFGRDGMNGYGGTMNPDDVEYRQVAWTRVFFDAVSSNVCPNAFFLPENSQGPSGNITFCAGLLTTDIFGHEYQHGVTEYSIRDGSGQITGMLYANEPGAINEGLSDIFGQGIERSVLGSGDWLAGTGSSFGAIRSAIDPETGIANSPQPARTGSPNYYCQICTGGNCENIDNGGVHYNNSVLSHAAYLMAEGGTENGCTIAGIGQLKGEQIFYRALTRYFNYSTNYSAAYAAILQACEDLYGDECIQVRKALLAVEMDQAPCTGAHAVPSCAAVADGCPSDPNKTWAGVCGCGIADTDSDGDGTPDCADLDNVVPPAPKLKTGKKRFTISMAARSGVTYYIKVKNAATRKRKSKITYWVASTPKAYVKVKAGQYTVSYAYSTGGTNPSYSALSKAKKVTVK